MFARVKSVRTNGRIYQYVQIVESRRVNGRVHQRLIGNLGRLDELLAKGDLRRVIEGLVAHCPQVKLAEAQRTQSLAAEEDRAWGAALVFERLWCELGLQDLLRRLAKPRHFGFDAERCAFALVLQRLLSPGSDLQGSQWIHTIHVDGFSPLRLPHFYRTVGALWRWKEPIEHHLHERGLDLFNQDLDLVFFDTTSTYFEGIRWAGWAKRGHSRDHRADHLQLVLGVVMRRDGFPVTCEIWPGNMADVKTLIPVVEALRSRFRIRKVVFVCDRGMVSAANLKKLTEAGFPYIVGMKMRRLLEVREGVLRRAGRYREVAYNLHVKEVWVDDRRYVVCLNPERADKDRRDREALLAMLRRKLTEGGVKKLINNRGYRRFLKVIRGSAEIDEGQVLQDARYDGKFVLRTTTDLPAVEVAEAYKQLTWIERLWRELKDVMEVRPIFHHLKKDNVKGHIFSCFLALYLSAALRHRLHEDLAAQQPKDVAPPDGSQPPTQWVPWNDLMRDLQELRAITVRLDGDRYLLRTELKGHANRAFRALGLRPPPLATVLPPAAAPKM